MRIRNYTELFSILPEEERTIVDVLRQIIIETLPSNCKEKISLFLSFMAIRVYVLFGLQPFQEEELNKEFYLAFGMEIMYAPEM